MKNEFTSFDVAKALDIPMERLRQWMKHGFITPSIPASGQGTKAVFTRWDVYQVALFRHLVEMGFSRQESANYVINFITIQAKEPERQQANYIVFTSKKDGNDHHVVTSMSFAGKRKWLLDLETGLVEIMPGVPLRDYDLDPDTGVSVPKPITAYDAIIIINFKHLREEVDAALDGS